ncbi:MAG: hypothetical protein HYI21_03225 [Sediminibacterium sp. Gen4]|jgi:hypothetical protein|uniref:hypothetical protein n=1 Tax=unclassified Sediminibacterium TaxID=2635961 RepID=UPI0015B86085|nr:MULTISPECIES: hypothetical protein [unclassified Sediminibacterium]MBW0164537.1 hypothetical protein [Sediminibacterium sp.]NWK65017.1 hypothetical protein [Sediminibacterium sp. Gen4]
MALTTRQKEMIADKLKRINGACPICSQKNWTIGDEIVSATSVSLGGSTVMGGPFIPMAQVVCNNCGFVSHHAVALLGISLND